MSFRAFSHERAISVIGSGIKDMKVHDSSFYTNTYLIYIAADQKVRACCTELQLLVVSSCG